VVSGVPLLHIPLPACSNLSLPIPLCLQVDSLPAESQASEAPSLDADATATVGSREEGSNGVVDMEEGTGEAEVEGHGKPGPERERGRPCIIFMASLNAHKHMKFHTALSRCVGERRGA
jgi:hypothetical protein